MRLRTLVAAVAAFLPLSATPATAASGDVFLITGSGAITPGTSLFPTGQLISFTGTATTVGTHGVPGTYSCSFSVVLDASIAVGTGRGSGSCGPLQFQSCSWIAVVETWSVACTTPGAPSAAFECAVQRRDVQPTTRYDFICVGAIAEA